MKRKYTEKEVLDRVKRAADPKIDEILAQVPDDEISPATLERQQAQLMERARAYMAQEADPKPSGLIKIWQGTLDEIKKLGEEYSPAPSLAFRRDKTDTSTSSDLVDPDIDWIPVNLYTARGETSLILKHRGEHPEQLPKVSVIWNGIKLNVVTDRDSSSAGMLLLLIFKTQGEIEGVSCDIRLSIQEEDSNEYIVVEIETGSENLSEIES